MGKTFSGESSSVTAPILRATFWTPGRKIVGKVIRKFKTSNGPCWAIELGDPITLQTDEMSGGGSAGVVTAVSIGQMRGLMDAIELSGCGELQVKDAVTIEATGSMDTGKESEMVLFKVSVIRP